MNLIDAIKSAYIEACKTESFMYVRRETEMFDIRVRPYSTPEMRNKIKYPISPGYFLSMWEWGLKIRVEDMIADDWIVAIEELR